MDWLLFCVVWKCIFETGFAFPAAGMRPLWEMLSERIRADGGEIRLGARVVRLRRDTDHGGGRVVAAVLDSGEEIEAEAFFSSVGGAETAALAGEARESVPPVGDISIAEGIAVLDAPPARAGLEDTVIFYSRDDSFAFDRPEGLLETRNGVICAPGNYLPHDPAGENILKVTQLANYAAWRALPPEEYARAKRAAADGMAETLRSFGVDVAALRERKDGGKYGWFDDVFTPLTLERYTLHAEGALYGSPVKSRGGETARANLFLIGADQGFHGIVGAMLSGVAMANAHWLAK
jgi:phytoene dehydrogenase-like protein